MTLKLSDLTFNTKKQQNNKTTDVNTTEKPKTESGTDEVSNIEDDDKIRLKKSYARTAFNSLADKDIAFIRMLRIEYEKKEKQSQRNAPSSSEKNYASENKISQQISNNNKLISMSIESQEKSLKLLQQIKEHISEESDGGLLSSSKNNILPGWMNTMIGLLPKTIAASIGLYIGTIKPENQNTNENNENLEPEIPDEVDNTFEDNEKPPIPEENTGNMLSDKISDGEQQQTEIQEIRPKDKPISTAFDPNSEEEVPIREAYYNLDPDDGDTKKPEPVQPIDNMLTNNDKKDTTESQQPKILSNTVIPNLLSGLANTKKSLFNIKPPKPENNIETKPDAYKKPAPEYDERLSENTKNPNIIPAAFRVGAENINNDILNFNAKEIIFKGDEFDFTKNDGQPVGNPEEGNSLSNTPPPQTHASPVRSSGSGPVEPPPPESSAGNLSGGLSGPGSIATRTQSTNTKGASLTQLSFNMEAATNAMTPNISVVPIYQEVDSNSQEPIMQNFIDPDEPGPVVPFDAKKRYAEWFNIDFEWSFAI
jgi:hypothetical protein